MDDGLAIKLSEELCLDCHVDADFAGNCVGADADDPSSVCSCTGFVIWFSGVPVIWASKVQTEIAQSTVEAEHVTCSVAMWKLIQLRTLLFELDEHFSLELSS